MRDRVKRMLGFVLVATIDGPPGSPRQTHIPRSRLQSGFGDHYRWPLQAFHSSRVAVLGHGDSNPKGRFGPLTVLWVEVSRPNASGVVPWPTCRQATLARVVRFFLT